MFPSFLCKQSKATKDLEFRYMYENKRLNNVYMHKYNV